MIDILKKYIDLILIFLLPVTFIFMIALLVYVPAAFVSTNFDFIYSTCTSEDGYVPSDCYSKTPERYSVINDKLSVNYINKSQGSHINSDSIKKQTITRIFLHDTKRNVSKEISLDEAKLLTLSNLATSPDGIIISNNNAKSGIKPFLVSDIEPSSYYYLIKGRSRKRLNLVDNTSSYDHSNNIRFIGWVLPN